MLRFFVLLAVLIFHSMSAASVHAANVPDTAGAFVAYCTTHFADCKSKVVDSDVATMAAMLFAKKPGQLCPIPKGVGNDAATKDILAWLGSHKNVHATPTDDAIQVAVKSLWHCQLQIGDGSKPGGPPTKTGAFVAYCPKNYAKCEGLIVAMTVTVKVPNPPKHCSPPEDMKTKEMSTVVLAWLAQHKDLHDSRTEDGIIAAFDNLWPCRH